MADNSSITFCHRWGITGVSESLECRVFILHKMENEDAIII